MTEGRDMALVLERTLAPVRQRNPAREEAQPKLNIAVIFTSVEATLAALRSAGALGGRLGARVTLFAAQVVPYPLPLESPPVLLDFSERRFQAVAGESPVETTVRLYLCRDALETLQAVLAPRSLVVMAGRKRWWPTAERRTARKLRRQGHEVIFTEME